MGQEGSVYRVYISDPPLSLSSTIPSRRSTLPLYLPSATKATVWQGGKRRGFLSRGRARYPYLGRQLVSVLQWMPMGRTPCRISMTPSHWVCTGRAHGPPSQKGWEQSPSSTLHPTTKAFYWFIWMIIGQKAERAPCPSTISCGGGFVAMSCTSTGALNSAIARQNQWRTAEA